MGRSFSNGSVLAEALLHSRRCKFYAWDRFLRSGVEAAGKRPEAALFFTEINAGKHMASPNMENDAPTSPGKTQKFSSVNGAPAPLTPEQRIAQLEAEVSAERARCQQMELALARAQAGADVKMTGLAQFLLESLTQEGASKSFENPALAHLDNPEEARCWLHDLDCPRVPGLESFGERMERCSECNVFKQSAPDSYTKLGELVNAILFLLERRHTQYRDAQEQLIQSEKLAGLGELAAGLAHEINTPTGIILARLDCMNLDSGDSIPSELKGDLEVIRSHADRLRKLTASLTSFARRHRIEKRPVVLQQVLVELLDIAERLIQKGNIELTAKLPEPLMVAFADGTLIQQVFMNLIINARDAMPDGGRLDISGWSQGNEHVLEFRDTGTGMEPEVMKRIFDPFFTTKDNRGTGLGLSVSYSILKDHAGRIEVDSEQGTGTVFRIILPKYTHHGREGEIEPKV